MPTATHALKISLLTSAVLLNACATADPSSVTTPGLSQRQARDLVTGLYDALNQPAKKDVEHLVKSSTTSQWLSCGGNDTDCAGQSAVIAGFKRRGVVIPDLKWGISDLIVNGNTVTVRGEASGTPELEFLGVQPTGKSFRILYISIHSVRNGKINHSYHIEDYAGAIRQLTAR